MSEIILIKNGEIALKGLNRGSFEDALIKNIGQRLRPLCDFTAEKAQSTIALRGAEADWPIDEALSRVSHVFGVAALSRALELPKDYAAIEAAAGDYLRDELSAACTFKVEAKRADKKFPLQSPDICRMLGEHLLGIFPHLSVDLHRPDAVVQVEIRDRSAFLHAGQMTGVGGIPVGTSGRAAVLISGGIDSPVAAYRMAKRGLSLIAVHFVTPPYTGPGALDKVERLLQKVAAYAGRIEFFAVPFTEISEAIRDHCREDLMTVIMRRCMMAVSERIARRAGADALVTGESLGQVASQTVAALHCTGSAVSMPVFRPLIGMDKREIIETAREIDTFDISVEPFEDCCVIFTPRHPKTRPSLSEVVAEEGKFDFAPLIAAAAEGAERKSIRPY